MDDLKYRQMMKRVESRRQRQKEREERRAKKAQEAAMGIASSLLPQRRGQPPTVISPDAKPAVRQRKGGCGCGKHGSGFKSAVRAAAPDPLYAPSWTIPPPGDLSGKSSAPPNRDSSGKDDGGTKDGGLSGRSSLPPVVKPKK